MKIRFPNQSVRAFTRTDLLILILIAVLFVAWLLPYLSPPRYNRIKITCALNLQQVGLGLRLFSNEHGDKFPWQVSTNNGGSMQYATTGDVFRHFQVASNEMSSPKILVCPVDQGRSRIGSWDLLRNSNISYFVGLDANVSMPGSFLSGDRTISTNQAVFSRLLTFTTNTPVQWAKDLHSPGGNLLFADGSWAEVSSRGLRFRAQNTGFATNRLLIP